MPVSAVVAHLNVQNGLNKSASPLTANIVFGSGNVSEGKTEALVAKCKKMHNWEFQN